MSAKKGSEQFGFAARCVIFLIGLLLAGQAASVLRTDNYVIIDHGHKTVVSRVHDPQSYWLLAGTFLTFGVALLIISLLPDRWFKPKPPVKGRRPHESHEN